MRVQKLLTMTIPYKFRSGKENNNYLNCKNHRFILNTPDWTIFSKTLLINCSKPRESVPNAPPHRNYPITSAKNHTHVTPKYPITVNDVLFMVFTGGFWFQHSSLWTFWFSLLSKAPDEQSAKIGATELGSSDCHMTVSYFIQITTVPKYRIVSTSEEVIDPNRKIRKYST